MVSPVSQFDLFQHFINPWLVVFKSKQTTVISQVLATGQVIVQKAAVPHYSYKTPCVPGTGAEVMPSHSHRTMVRADMGGQNFQ